MGYRSNTVSSIMIIYGHSRSLSFPASLDYYSGSLPSPLSTKESTLRPSGSCCPGSSSTNVSRILVSTCSDGSSVRTFFFPRIRPTRITWPQNLCVPYASAVTYARCPTFSFETSLSSTSKRTRRTESSAMVITGESNCVETLSPPCRSVLLLLVDFVVLFFDRDGLQFKMAAAQERSRSDEFPRRQIFGREVALVDRIKLFEQRQISAGDLHVHQVIHGHPGLRQHFFVAIQQQLDFVFNLFRRFSRLRIQPDAPCKVQCVPRENRVAERCLHGFLRKVDRFSRRLYGYLRKSSLQGKNSSHRQDHHQETDATIHGCPPIRMESMTLRECSTQSVLRQPR